MSPISKLMNRISILNDQYMRLGEMRVSPDYLIDELFKRKPYWRPQDTVDRRLISIEWAICHANYELDEERKRIAWEYC